MKKQAKMVFNLVGIIVAILCGYTYGNLHSCWLSSCEKIASIEQYTSTMLEKQDNMTTMLSEGPDIGTFAETESNITATIVNEIDLSEIKIIDAVSNATNDILETVNASISDMETNMKEEIVMVLNNTEGNLVSAMSDQIVTVETNVIDALGNKTDEVITGITMGVIDSVRTINETIRSVVGETEEYIVDTLAANITASEFIIIDALANKTDEVIAFVNSTISDAVAIVNGAIANAVNASESNIVNDFMVELNGTASDILATIKAEIEATQQNLSMKIDELAGIIDSLQPPVSSGFTVGSIIKEVDVELDIFSGVINPTWKVTGASKNWASLVVALSGSTSTPLPSRLGYRGFIVTSLLQDGSSVTQMFGHAQQASSTLETALLNSNGGALSTDLVSVVTATINGLTLPDVGGPQSPLDPDSIPNINPKCGSSRQCVEPSFDPGQWTTVTDNSYNYALQLPTGTYAQPGRYHGEMYSGITGEEIRGAALQDKLIDLDDTSVGVFPDIENNCLISLVILPGLDFHFLRRDSGGTWSHKPGPRDPINLDNSGQAITDPRTADIAPYKFVRFLAVCPKKVNIN